MVVLMCWGFLGGWWVFLFVFSLVLLQARNFQMRDNILCLSGPIFLRCFTDYQIRDFCMKVDKLLPLFSQSK